MDLIVSSGSVFSAAFDFYSRVTSLSFASSSGSESEAAYIVVNFGDGGCNNGTIYSIQLRMTIPTVVNLYFGQIWSSAVKFGLWGRIWPSWAESSPVSDGDD